MRILILTGGRIDEAFVRDYLNSHTFDHTIVVDGALAVWDRWSDVVSFDHLVGDFDTVSGDILAKYLDREDLTVHRFNPEKDYTDTDIALKLAMDLCKAADDEAKEIVLLGATGTRLDHMMANLQLLEQLRGSGITGVIQDAYNRITLIEGSTKIRKDQQFGDYVSLIPVTDRLAHVDLTGFKYPLTDHLVKMGESLCVSNEIVAEEALIHIGEGRAFLIESRD